MSNSTLETPMHPIAAFYNECQHRTAFKAYQFDGYGQQRAIDCYYAEKTGLFERVSLGKQVHFRSGNEILTTFAWIYKRPGDALDMPYVIAPDTRVPSYTGSLGDALELARLVGMETIPVPATGGEKGIQELIASILQAVDVAFP